MQLSVVYILIFLIIHVEQNLNNLQICNEFARLMADDSILSCGINRLLQLTPKILHCAKSKASNPLIQKYLQLLDQGDEHDDDTADHEARDVTDGELMFIT